MNDPVNPLTEEQQVEFQKRRSEFEEKLIALQKEYQLEIVSFPQFQPTPMGYLTGSVLAMRDTKYAPVVSPIQRNVIKDN